MVRTYGLTHLALFVQDVRRSLRFYEQVLGVVPVYQQEGFIQVQTPGSRDVIVFEESTQQANPEGGGIRHFGFRLVNPADIDRVAEEVERAGGTVTAKGEFCPGEPYVFFRDPDGYEVEIWHELPTPVDPQ
jgi:catechol 2,3-dioxygenase-like lactoylglutathione lyase family enzyme